jgi:hypothetical protein
MHEQTTPDDNVLFDRLCPVAKDGTRRFANVMFRRLRKLGAGRQCRLHHHRAHGQRHRPVQ